MDLPEPELASHWTMPCNDQGNMPNIGLEDLAVSSSDSLSQSASEGSQGFPLSPLNPQEPTSPTNHVSGFLSTSQMVPQDPSQFLRPDMVTSISELSLTAPEAPKVFRSIPYAQQTPMSSRYFNSSTVSVPTPSSQPPRYSPPPFQPYQEPSPPCDPNPPPGIMEFGIVNERPHIRQRRRPTSSRVGHGVDITWMLGLPLLYWVIPGIFGGVLEAGYNILSYLLHGPYGEHKHFIISYLGISGHNSLT